MVKRPIESDNEIKDAISPDAVGSQGESNPADIGPSAEGGGAGATNADLEDLKAQLAEKDRELGELKDKYLRVLADTENARKRLRQQSEETVRIQRENVLRDLLPIVDNLERAVDAARAGGENKSIVEGIEMVLRSLLELLRSHGVTQVTAVGRPFDPQLHEAVDHVHSHEHPPNTVIGEFHRGYQIGERMLRPARVAVAKGHDGGPSGGKGNSGANGIENN